MDQDPDQEPTAAHTLRLSPITVQPLRPAEVGALWSFVHGDIMVGGIREQLRASLGLCPRHTWGYAAVEIELWQTGAGSRGGHQPFDVGVLYGDLLEDATAAIRHSTGRSDRHFRSVLTPQGECRICLDTRPGSMKPFTGFAGSNSDELAAEANELRFTREWCTQTRPMWSDRVCPDCAGESGDDLHLCRQHLAERGSPGASSTGAIAQRLDTVRGHLRRLVDSMTQNGEPATGDDDASWIETLAWFAGWSVPLRLTQAPD